MGKYVNDGKVTIPDEHEFGSTYDILEEIAILLNVAKGADGFYHHADVNTSPSINMEAKYKPEYYPPSQEKYFDITDEDRYNNGYGLSMNRGGYDLTAEITIDRLKSIEYTTPDIHRIRDFNGYNHTTRSGIRLIQSDSDLTTDEAVYIWSAASLFPDGVPLDNSYDNMVSDGSKIADYVEFGYMAMTYSGFVRKKEVIGATLSELKMRLEGTQPYYIYSPTNDFRLEPEGRKGEVFVYGKDSVGNYTQLMPSINVKKPGSVHPIEISWNPAMTIGTTTTGFNIQVKDWLRGSRKNEYIMFGKDDDLYFGFTIYNNSTSRKALGSSLKLAMTVGNKTYYTWFSDDSSSAFAGSFSVDPLKSYGPYSYPSTGGVIVQRPRFFVQLKSLANIFPEFFNQQKYDVTFSLYYTGDTGGALETEGIKESGVLVSRFTIPMQCTGKETENPIDPPSDIKPTPPDWDVEVQD